MPVKPIRTREIPSRAAYQDLLLLIGPGPETLSSAPLALDAAARHGARLTVFYLAPLPSPANDGATPARERLDAIAEETEDRFRRMAADAGVVAIWRNVIGEIDDVVSEALERTRSADLVIASPQLPRWPGFATDTDMSFYFVLDAGRPVLFVPPGRAFDAFGDRVMVAWNTSREAARAVNDALPILEGAERVTVLRVENDPLVETFPEPAKSNDIASHLGAHGIPVNMRQTYAANRDIGETILSRAEDSGSDLLVMGAAGHSRVRRAVLGPATRHLLDNMTIPVLMSC